MTAIKDKTREAGDLVPVCRNGIRHGILVECVTCGTTYPVMDGKTWCNSHIITKCPWCRPDSKPWQNGRGI